MNHTITINKSQHISSILQPTGLNFPFMGVDKFNLSRFKISTTQLINLTLHKYTYKPVGLNFTTSQVQNFNQSNSISQPIGLKISTNRVEYFNHMGEEFQLEKNHNQLKIKVLNKPQNNRIITSKSPTDSNNSNKQGVAR